VYGITDICCLSAWSFSCTLGCKSGIKRMVINPCDEGRSLADGGASETNKGYTGLKACYLCRNPLCRSSENWVYELGRESGRDLPLEKGLKQV